MWNFRDDSSSWRWGKQKDDGITDYILICPLEYRYSDVPGSVHPSICINDDTANPIKLNTADIVDTWTIELNYSRTDLGYMVPYTYHDFGTQDIGSCSAWIDTTNFSELGVEYIGSYHTNGESLTTDGSIKTADIIVEGTRFYYKRISGSGISQLSGDISNLFKLYDT